MNSVKSKKEAGFTLIEMMIVMLVISVLLIVTIPNVAKHNSNINNKGCDAFEKMVQAQVQAYRMEENKIPTIAELKEEGYINDETKGCPGKTINIDGEGKVTLVVPTASNDTP